MYVCKNPRRKFGGLRQKQLFLSKHDSTPPSPDEGGYRTKWLLVADGLMKREIAQGAIVADSFYLQFHWTRAQFFTHDI